MKKIKTFNKLLSSLTLLSSLSGIGFNNQYQNSQKVITENSKVLNNNFYSNAAPVQMGDIYVNLDETGKIIQSYASGTGSLVIADYITQIADNAFNYCTNLSGDLVVPSNLETIEINAFWGTNITSLDLTQATSLTTIGNYAFKSCSNLSGELFIPSSLTSIGYDAFGKTKLTSFNVDQSNTAYSLAKNLGSNAKVLITGTDGIWKDDSKSVGELALGDIVIPSNVTTIKDDAFYGSNITSLDLSQATSLTTIEGDGAFGEGGAFSYCQNLTGKLVIPSSVTSIGAYAFHKTKITSLDLSQATSLTTIGDNAFGYVNITSLDLSNARSLTTIGNNAFHNCSNLSKAILPISLKELGIGVFKFSNNLSSVNFESLINLKIISSDAFSSCSLTGDLVIPSSVTTIGSDAFSNNTIDNLYFLSETPPTSFGANWQPTVTGKVYVPTEQSKQAYLKAENFGFTEDQIEILSKNSNTGLILGLLFGLGIPIFATIGFGIWYFNKKKKNNTKI